MSLKIEQTKVLKLFKCVKPTLRIVDFHHLFMTLHDYYHNI